jgi:serine/threonine protein kinase
MAGSEPESTVAEEPRPPDASDPADTVAPGPSVVDTYATRAYVHDEIATRPPLSTEGALTRPPRTDWDSGAGPGELDPTTSYIMARGQGSPRLDPLVSRSTGFARGVVLQGRYELSDELGRGGMGVVYLGRDVRLDRPVAIKAILSEVAGAGGERHRDAFAEEARLGANLTHPAIATVYDYGFQGDSPFAVFEFIPGQTLRDVVQRRGKLPLDEVRLIVGSLAQALDFAHERHVVHRDLKPENIRATEQGQFKILDLGLAKNFHHHDDWSFCGTPAYASPEQASALPCDGRTDQYALALITFELLTGTRPFVSKSWVTLLEMHAQEPPPRIQTIQPDIPTAVGDAIEKALSKDPNRRFATCTEFATALGCQILSAPAPRVEVLLETTSKKMWGRWKSFSSPFALWGQPRIQLALTSDALWATYRKAVMRWPIGAIASSRARGRKLELRLNVTQGKKVQTLLIASRKECREWQGRLEALILASKPVGTAEELPGTIPEPLAEPTLDPIVLLQTRPATRFQLLGPVEVKTRQRKQARPALAIRGLMMRADAIIDVQEERLPGAFRTEHRASGTAVRAVDREGRLELKARWFDVHARAISRPMVVIMGLASFFILLLFVVALAFPRPGPSRTRDRLETAFALPGVLFQFGLAVVFARLRWPQLARPIAVCYLASLGASVVEFVTRTAAGFLHLPTEAAMTNAGSVLLNSLMSLPIYVFIYWIGRRALAIDRDYREIIAGEEAEIDPTRRAVSRVVWVLLGIYLGWLVVAFFLGGYLFVGGGQTPADPGSP